MSILLSQDLWLFLAGISIFLYWLELIEDVCSWWSSTIQKLIQKWTNTKRKSILSWVWLISILQSSHAVSLLILAFVWWGLVSIVHGVSMVIGMNVGTVFTEALIWFFGLWFDIWPAVLPFIAVGWLWFLFNKKYRNFFAILLGLGLLFFWLDMMKDSVGTIKSMIDITKYLSYPLIVYFLVWFIWTVLTQSSSAMTVIIMTAVYEWLIPLEVAAMCVMWCYVWTTTTALFVAMTWDNWLKKQVALSHFGFNIIVSIIFGLFFSQVMYLIKDIRWFGTDAPWFGSLTKSAVNGFIVFFLIFKAVWAILFLPFIDLYTKLIQWIVPYKDENKLNIDSINKEVSWDTQWSLFQKDWTKFQQDVLSFDLDLINKPDTFDIQNYKELKDRFNKLFAFMSNFDYKTIGKDVLYWEKYFLSPIIELMQSAKSAKDTHTDLMNLYNNKSKDNHYNFIQQNYNKAIDIIQDDEKNENKLEDIIRNMDQYESKLISSEMQESNKLYPDLGIIMHTFNNIEHSLSNLISAFQSIKSIE